MPQPKEPPEKKIGPFPNGLGVAIWVNEAQTAQSLRLFRSITIAPRRYLDRETNQWKDSNSYQPGDLPALIHALKLALEHCDHVAIPGQEPGFHTDADAQGAPPPNGDVPF